VSSSPVTGVLTLIDGLAGQEVEWLTPSGLDGVRLGEPPALRTPQRFSLRTSHSIRVAWAAADIACGEHPG
jgi:hypothetical protein